MFKYIKVSAYEGFLEYAQNQIFFFKSLIALNPKNINRISKIDHLCLSEENLSIINNYTTLEL